MDFYDSQRDVYGDETVDSILSALESDGKRLNAVAEMLEEEKTFRGQFSDEEDYNSYVRMRSYEKLRDDPDFEAKSQYQSTYKPGTEKFNAWTGTYVSSGFGDIDYDYINRDETARQRYQLNSINNNTALLGLDNSERLEMEEDEIAIFNYLYAQGEATGDMEHTSAYQYIQDLTGQLNYRQAQAIQDRQTRGKRATNVQTANLYQELLNAEYNARQIDPLAQAAREMYMDEPQAPVQAPVENITAPARTAMEMTQTGDAAPVDTGIEADYNGDEGGDSYGQTDGLEETAGYNRREGIGDGLHADTGGAGADGAGPGKIAAWAEGAQVQEPGEPAKQAVKTAQSYGVRAVVVQDAAIKARNSRALALTEGGIVYLSDILTEGQAKTVAPHEAVYAVKQRGSTAYEVFLENVGGALNLHSQTADYVLKVISKGRFDGQDLLDLTPAQQRTVFDELNALIWGCHKADAQNARAQFQDVFTDYDGYIRALNDIMEAEKAGVREQQEFPAPLVQLAQEMAGSSIANMTQKERAFAAAHRYFNVTSKEAINAVSEKLKGYSLAQVENYFPIRTDSSFTRAEFESIKRDGTIEGMGFLKERVDAANPILLRDMGAELEQSVKMHSKYVGLAIPVRNFNKLWNVTTGQWVDTGGGTGYTGAEGGGIDGLQGSVGSGLRGEGEGYETGPGKEGTYSSVSGRVAKWAENAQVREPGEGPVEGVKIIHSYGVQAVVVQDAALKTRRSTGLALTSDGVVYLSDTLTKEQAKTVAHHEAGQCSGGRKRSMRTRRGS